MNLEDGTPLRIRYSALDMGPILNAFDGNDGTLIRSEQANPLRMQLFFNDPEEILNVTVRVGGTPTEVTAEVYLPRVNPIPSSLNPKNRKPLIRGMW